MILDLKKLTNTELIRRCAEDPHNRRLLWVEFCSRFDERIWLIVYRECQDKGLAKKKDQIKLTVQDLVQEVYLNLLKNDCKALTSFIGASENSMYTYLGIIARNVVCNYVTKMNAQKRPNIDKPLNDTSSGFNDYEIFKISQINKEAIEQDLSLEMLKEEIDLILNQNLKDKYKERNKLIFKLYFYEEFSPEEIASKLGFEITSKRVLNLVAELKTLLRRELLSRKVAVYS